MSHNPLPLLLYIEDDEDSRNLVTRVLRADFAIITAADALAGYEMALTSHPDLIIMDINLPHMRGHEVATVLRSNNVSVPIVAFTAADEQKDEFLAAGCVGFIKKPITDVRQFRSQVLRYFEGVRDTFGRQAQERYLQNLSLSLQTAVKTAVATDAALGRDGMAKNKFATVVDHEFRTPLALLVGNYDLMKLYPVDSEEYCLAFKNMGSVLTNLQKLVGRLSIIGRLLAADDHHPLSSYEIEPINMGDLVEAVVNDMAQLARDGDRELIITSTQTPGLLTYGMLAMVRLMLEELLSNAIKFTPDGGTVSVNLQETHLVIADTGDGMSPQDIPFLQHPFASTNSPNYHTTSRIRYRGGGLGIGLFITRQIIEMHKWEMKIQGELGKGTTVTILF